MRRIRDPTDMTLLGRGHHYAWEKVRRAIMLRDMWRCQACSEQAEVVDYILPRWAGGSDAWDNLQALCHRCHRIKTLAEFPSAVAGQRRLIYGPDPRPREAPAPRPPRPGRAAP